MDIGGPYTADTPRFYVVINGKRMKPCGKGVRPYRFNKDRARQETECTELNNKVMRENIRIEPVESTDQHVGKEPYLFNKEVAEAEAAAQKTWRASDG